MQMFALNPIRHFEPSTLRSSSAKKSAPAKKKPPKVFVSKNPIPLKDWLKGKNSPPN